MRGEESPTPYASGTTKIRAAPSTSQQPDLERCRARPLSEQPSHLTPTEAGPTRHASAYSPSQCPCSTTPRRNVLPTQAHTPRRNVRWHPCSRRRTSTRNSPHDVQCTFNEHLAESQTFALPRYPRFSIEICRPATSASVDVPTRSLHQTSKPPDDLVALQDSQTTSRAKTTRH